MSPISAHHAPEPASDYLDGRDVARVLGIRLSELVAQASSPDGLPVIPVKPRRVLVSASELDAWERRRTVGSPSRPPALSAAVRRLQDRRRGRHHLRRPSAEAARRAGSLLP